MAVSAYTAPLSTFVGKRMSSKKSTQKYTQKYMRKYQAAWYRKNCKKIAKRMAAWYRKNRKQALKQQTAYYRKNRKAIAKRRAVYRRENHEKFTKRAGAYRRENHENLRKRGVAHSRTIAGRHKHLLQRHKRQLAPRGIKGVPMSLKAHQKKLFFADGRERRCWYCLGVNNKCGSGLDRLDNNITYTVKNTVPCCRGCNVWRGSTHTVQETRDHFKPMRDAARRGH
jgi:hypothetical protein